MVDHISISSLFLACNALDAVTYNVPESASTFFPFGLKHVRLEFEEGTFGGAAMLKFKVRVKVILLSSVKL